jgi:virginiamycin B lyase
MRSLIFLAATPVLLGAQQSPGTPPSFRPEITEWKVPWEGSRPRDPYVGPDGKVWFVGQQGNYVAWLDPEKGEFKRFEIDRGTHPHNLIVDGRGQVWFAGNRNGMIGRLDPATGTVTRYPMPDSAVRDPHTLEFDRDGNIWFTAQQSNYVGKLTVRTGRIQLIRVPTERARPYGIRVDSKNRPWFNEFGSNRIGMVDPATMKIREYTLPDRRTQDRRIEITSDDMVWYGDYTRGYLGRLDPGTGQVREWAAPSGAKSLPYGMTSDGRGRIWMVETGVQPNQLVGFDPALERFFSVTPILPSGGGTVRHMHYHRPSGEIWFGTDANTIGRARVNPSRPST